MIPSLSAQGTVNALPGSSSVPSLELGPGGLLMKSPGRMGASAAHGMRFQTAGERMALIAN
jgi:hypothetical protein